MPPRPQAVTTTIQLPAPDWLKELAGKSDPVPQVDVAAVLRAYDAKQQELASLREQLAREKARADYLDKRVVELTAQAAKISAAPKPAPPAKQVARLELKVVRDAADKILGMDAVPVYK